ncbi:MAG: MIP family channel protein [Thermoanaerobaculia bacterium]
MSFTTTQRALAEFVGTFALIFVGAGSILVNQMTGGGTGLPGIALAHGLAIAVMVSAIGHISGGHINPAVTFAALLARRISPSLAAAYVAAQLAGAVAAAMLLAPLFDAQTRQAVQLGTPALGAGVTAGQAILFEAIATFFLVFVVAATGFDERGAFKAVAGFPIGLTVTIDILVGGPLTGAAMNPARAFGPAVVAGYWSNHWVYWIGPLLGAGIAALLYSAAYLRGVPRPVAR